MKIDSGKKCEYAKIYCGKWDTTKDDMYQDETGYEKGEVQKRKIVETEIFLVDERMTIISGIIAIMGKKEGEST